MITMIRRICPGAAAKVLALVHLGLGAIGTAFGFALFQMQETPEPYSGLWPVVPLFYAGAGFLMTFIAVLLYNLVAKLFGGIKIDLDTEITTGS
jgi:hypothetical protein